jgi:pimeloyl-ACP methyl ester carboxylesterase
LCGGHHGTQACYDERSGPAIVFLPGIVAPAAIRYAPLIRELGPGIQAFTKELDIYDSSASQDAYSIDAEVRGLASAADAAALSRFYLYGHSAGGAIGVAFATAHPERLLGLALDEPGSDYSDETSAFWRNTLEPVMHLPPEQRTPAFLAAQVSPSVQLPPPQPGPPPDWMATRPAGIEKFVAAMQEHVETGTAPTFDGPVYYSHGSLSNPIWLGIRDRLRARYPNFIVEEYEGLHHMNTSNAAEPSRVAASLRRVWNL